jgi:hypothetical protein
MVPAKHQKPLQILHGITNPQDHNVNILPRKPKTELNSKALNNFMYMGIFKVRTVFVTNKRKLYSFK